MNAPAPSSPLPESPPPSPRGGMPLWRRLIAACSATNRKGGDRILRFLGTSLCILYFVFAFSILVLRYAILPSIDSHRDEISARLGETLGLPVTIGRIESNWRGLSPDFILLDVRIDDREGRPALAFSRIDAVLSWRSLLHGAPTLSLLSIDEPALHIRREANGHIFVAGIPIDEKGGDSKAANWILQQRHIRIRGATVVWEDLQRGAPPLVLDNVNFALDNHGFQHRFGLSALPPRELAARLDLRGDLAGRDLTMLSGWHGTLFAQLDYTNLSAWRTWIDYPVALPQGYGGVRTWIGVGDGTLTEAVADVRLRDVRLQLAQTLSRIDLKSLEGRLGFAANGTEQRVSGRGLALETRNKLRIDPTDFSIAWAPLDMLDTSDNIPSGSSPQNSASPARTGGDQPKHGFGTGGRIAVLRTAAFATTNTFSPPDALPQTKAEIEVKTQMEKAPTDESAYPVRRWRGTAEISRVDLATLGALAAYLPLDEKTRRVLRDYAPTGQIHELRAAFSGNAKAVEHYALSAGFAHLGLRAQGNFPGFSGFSGSVDCDEKKGRAHIRSAHAGIEMPNVFSADPLRFDRINGLVTWTANGTDMEVELPHIAFVGADAEGSAQGRYVYNGSGAGTIDLTATLPRANGTAVWRYMPRSVNPQATEWLKQGIAAGTAHDTRLILRGDLARFPFSDGSGKFAVTSRITGARIDYAPGWPSIENLEAKLIFEGVKMTIEGERGKILGTTLGKVHAEIPDLDSHQAELSVAGEVRGPTMEFFRFIAQSPVRQSVGDLTQDLRAKGGGTLALKLAVPLEHSIDTRVQGDFLFVDNEVVFEPSLPPLTAVNGHLLFTESMVAVKEIKARFLNGPAILRAETKNGQAELTAQGTLAIPELQRELERSADGISLAALSGKIDWRVKAGIKKKLTGLVIESNLAGLASALPEPFAKTADKVLPLRLEKTIPSAQSTQSATQLSQWRLTLDKIVNGVLRYQYGGSGIEQDSVRTAVAVAIAGKTSPDLPAVPALPPLPERGMAVTMTAPRIDLTAWRTALETPGDGSRHGVSAPPDLRLNLKTSELVLFGRRLHQAELAVETPARNIWEMRVNSREADGSLRWDANNRGMLYARMKKFTLESPEDEAASKVTSKAGSDTASALKTLPALDIVAEEFSLGAKKLGRLELLAENETQTWRIKRLTVANPAGRLEGEGRWKTTEPQQVTLDFKLAADDVGKLLDRLDYPGAIKNGTAHLSGTLHWNGVPVSIDFPSLSGNMRLEAQKGQFAKLDPGAAKLLGLISLQSLPRRISLDFGDIFSSGFAFDTIAGDFALAGGVVRTEEFAIQGPAARVLMRGNADLARETQNLTVDIQPELGTTAALGVALVNPVAGAVTLLAHKVLQDPLNQIFAFSYRVTGTWDNPKVEKQPFTVKKPHIDPQDKTQGEASGEIPGNAAATEPSGASAVPASPTSNSETAR